MVVFESYPSEIRRRLEQLRSLIYEVAQEIRNLQIEETLKWGEPSYTSPIGSPIRIDWKEQSPEKISLFFNCNTLLIATFRDRYPDTFHFAGNREIYFGIDEVLPLPELKKCMALALTYQQIKSELTL